MGALAKMNADLWLSLTCAQHQQCRQVEAQKEVSTRRANVVRRQQASLAMAEGMQQASQGYYAAAQSNRTLNCTHSPAIGWGSSTTTCY